MCKLTGKHRWTKGKSQNAIDPEKIKECVRCGLFRTVKPRAKKEPTA